MIILTRLDSLMGERIWNNIFYFVFDFVTDGKFILELARAREGEKTGWISVPRKTFWPPTISTNSSTTFSKHESSTSLSCE